MKTAQSINGGWPRDAHVMPHVMRPRDVVTAEYQVLVHPLSAMLRHEPDTGNSMADTRPA